MNKYQKALDNLKTMGDKDLYNERNTEWCDTLQELVDKETSKKANCYTFDKHTGTCPRCGITVYHFMNVYCQHCGQKLDRSDE